MARFPIIFLVFVLEYDIFKCVGMVNAVMIHTYLTPSARFTDLNRYCRKSNKFSKEHSQGRTSLMLRLRGGSEEIDEHENEVLKNLERLSLKNNEVPKSENRIDSVIEMAKSLKLTLKSLNKGLIEEDSSREIEPADNNASEITMEEISKLLTTRTDYDDIFKDESKFRDQVLDVMKQFDLDLEEDPNDPEIEKLHETEMQLEEAEQFAREQENQIHELKRILERQQRSRVVSDQADNILLVGDIRRDIPDTGDAFEQNTFGTISEAVNSSFRGQMVRLLAGRHLVGNALCCLGLTNYSIPLEWPNTIHLTAGWSVNISGESGSEADGRFFLLKDSSAQFKTFRILNRCSAMDSPFLGSNHLSDPGTMEPRITGIVLLEVWGVIDMEQCSATINGGICAAFIGGASGRFTSCQIGGFGPETDRGRETLDVPGVKRRFRHLLSDSEPRAAQGISVRNSSSIALQGCELCHIWNGGVSVHQVASAHLDNSTLHDVGYGVGMDDAAAVVVTACRIETSDDAILECAALYAMPNSSAVKVRCEHNVIIGREWIGRRRPGRVEPAPSASTWVDEARGGGDSGMGKPAQRMSTRRRNLAVEDEWSEEGEWDEDEVEKMRAELRSLQELLKRTEPAFPRFDLA
jgi:hypothetical protein